MREKRRLAARAVLLALIGALAVAAAGCGGDDGGGSTSIEGLGSSLEEIQERRGRRARSTSSSGPTTRS